MSNERPLIVIDTLCTLYKILDLKRGEKGKLLKKYTTKERDFLIEKGVDLYNTAYFLPEILSENPEIIWVGDSKKSPYWRTLQYRIDLLSGLIKLPDSKGVNLEDISQKEKDTMVDETSKMLAGVLSNEKTVLKPEKKKQKSRIGYKGNRDTCPFQQFAAKKLLSVSKAFTVPGFEADDIAAACTVIWPDRKIYLLTVDSDWLQLVNPNVTWLCMTGFDPGIRRLDTLHVWFGRKLLKEKKAVREQLDSSNPRHIALWKFLTGDVSDNLFVGTPLHYFDLLEPPAGLRLWENPEIVAGIKKAVRPYKPNKQIILETIQTGEKLPTPVYYGVKPDDI